MLLVKRANETAKTILPEESVVGMVYDAISKDPREELRMMPSYSSYNEQSVDEFLLTLQKSPHTGPFNSRHVKMNEFKSATIRYCNDFQEGECPFELKKNPDFQEKEVVSDDRKNKNIITNKNNNKFQFKRKNSNNQSHNVITDQTRNANVDGNPPKYSNQRHNFNDTNVNSEEQSNNKINSIWLFTKISGTTDINPRMYVLRRYATNVVIPDTDDFGNDSETFEWKYNNHYII